MRNWLLNMVKPKNARSVADLPARHKPVVMHKAAYEDAVYALNNLQSNEATIERAAQHPSPAVLRSLRMPEHLAAAGVQMTDIDDLRVIHVAGTKGKGSTCAFTESILRSHGYRTGLYTSPHLVAVRERIRINGKPISQELFAKYFWEVYNALEAQEAEKMLPMPAYFMFLTVMAFKVFVKEKVDVLVLEVGVGGEYDCTNVVRHPSVVGISSLGLDHTRLLGSSVQEIAWQKAGIMKPGTPALSVPQPEGALQVLVQRARERGCSLRLAPPLLAYDWEVPRCRLGIPGEPQLQNASLALQLCRAWLQRHADNIVADAGGSEAGKLAGDGPRADSSEHHALPSIAAPFSVSKRMARGLENCRWPGRCQVVPLGPSLTLFLDGAHTVESVDFCLRWFREARRAQVPPGTRPWPVLLFNCVGDRRPELMLSQLAEHPFRTALFTTNRVADDKSPYSDQSNFTVERCTETARCLSNMRIWCHLLSSQQEEDGEEEGPVPEDSCFVFPCISEVMRWLRREALAAQRATPPYHMQVLVTGSLHLVGGVMSQVDPELALS
uniref:Folylpolyglutamate synthase n=2 Tax=Ixodes ricinus TaxID=34613 RepID=A0A131XYQ1_IXORI